MFADDRLPNGAVVQDVGTDFLDELALISLDASNVLETLRTRRRNNVIINVKGFYDALICVSVSLSHADTPTFNWKRNRVNTRYRSKSLRHKQITKLDARLKEQRTGLLENRKFHLSALGTRTKSISPLSLTCCSIPK